MRRALALPLLLVLAGCPPEPHVEDYDATCQLDEDCTVVRDQEFCGQCDALGALNLDGAEAFLDDQEAHAKIRRCPSIILIGCVGPDEEAATAVCGADQRCEIVVPD